jgi:hypothetical protein
MQNKVVRDLTVNDIAKRLAMCTGESSAVHARQIRHWSKPLDDGEREPQSVMDAVYRTHISLDSPTAPRLYNVRHLAAAALFHGLAASRLDVEGLRTVAHLLRNNRTPHDDARAWQSFQGGFSALANDGLSLAMMFAKRIADGERPDDWRIYLELMLTRDGEIERGCVTTAPKGAQGGWEWRTPELRVINLSAFLPCLFRDEFGRAAYPGGEVAPDGTAIVWPEAGT